MWGLPTGVVVAFLAFSTFHFYMSLQVADYRGHRLGFDVFLTLLTFAGLVFQIGFWIHFGVQHGWGAAFKLALMVALLLGLVVIPLETWFSAKLRSGGRPLGPTTDLTGWLSLLGIPALPILAYVLVRLSSGVATDEGERGWGTWPLPQKAAYVERCARDIRPQLSDPSQATDPLSFLDLASGVCRCMADSLEAVFGLSRYNEMLAAQPNPRGTPADRALARITAVCFGGR